MPDETQAMVSDNGYKITYVEKGAPFSCDDGHAPISLMATTECKDCRGGDDYEGCHSFCPVCEWCCGC